MTVRHNTLTNVADKLDVAIVALASIHYEPADGLTIAEAGAIYQTTERHLRSLRNTIRWTLAMRDGARVEVE